MALISKITPIRLPIPDEDGEWMEIVPPTVLQLDRASQAATAGLSAPERTIPLLAQCVKAWSYDADVCEETIGDLDAKTYNWLTSQVNILTGQDDDEKKGSGSSSQPGQEPATAPTPPS